MVLTNIPKKGLYERGANFYAHVEGGYVSFALSLRMDTVVFLAALYDPTKVERAHAAGLKVFFYAGPGGWHPDNWRATRTRLQSLCRADHRNAGYVGDVEDWALAWEHQPESEIDALGHALDEDSHEFSVGFTSYPLWPRWERVALLAPHVWCSPQLYGIHKPQTPVKTLLSLGAQWSHMFGGGYCPSLAAWGRDAIEQRKYLATVKIVPSALFWHELPLPANDTFASLRDF